MQRKRNLRRSQSSRKRAPTPGLPPPEKASLADSLLHWFERHHRKLPWRKARDPYRIWVSEIMLQQTRVEAVRPYYERWMARFPTLDRLAEAPVDDVLKAWEGLGYYARARNLHTAVREVAARYGGAVPDDPEAVRSLPGVGPYTAGAILSIAFNRPEPAVDGNVLRVIARLYAIEADILKPSTRTAVEGVVLSLIPAGRAGDFNQALMELGALVCTPTSPRCGACPVAGACSARREGSVDRLPLRAKAKAPRPVDMVAGIVRRADGRLLLTRRPAEGLLGGLWEFPGGERPPDLSWERSLHGVLQERFGITVEVEAHLTAERQTFSHLVWNLHAYTCLLAGEAPAEAPDLRWVEPGELGLFAMPRSHSKLAAVLTGQTPAQRRLPL
jgi:A/G-specific adenine glycosylase